MAKPVGKAQELLYKKIQQLKKQGVKSVELADLTRSSAGDKTFVGIHFGKLVKAMKALHDKGLVKDFDGSKVILEDVDEGVDIKDYFVITEDSRSVISVLRDIADRDRAATVVFDDGKKLKVLPSMAQMMLASYNALRGPQKQKFADLISKKKANFDRTLNTLYRSLAKKRR